MGHLTADKQTRQRRARDTVPQACLLQDGRDTVWNDHVLSHSSQHMLAMPVERYCTAKLEQASHPTQHDGGCSARLQAHYQHTIKHMGHNCQI